MARPTQPNVIILVSDSLRFDSAFSVEQAGMPYVWDHSTRFMQARAAGCWTLPATASMFSGMLPHQHGATSQTRKIQSHFATLAEHFQAAGYKTYQNTGNPVTTEIFGIDRGIERTDRIWMLEAQRHRMIDTFLVMFTKARVRKKWLRSLAFIEGKMAEDMEAARAWMQSNALRQFAMTNEVIEQHNKAGYPVFAFVNIMESHFPYHIADTFETYHKSFRKKMEEYRALFHLANQTRMIKDFEPISDEMLHDLLMRQHMAWKRVAPLVDNWIQDIHQDKNNFVVFCSDHGDNFGEHNWQYHFQNVTDAGTLVPFFVLDPEQDEGREVTIPVSTRDLYGTTLARTGLPTTKQDVDLVEDAHRSVPVLESYWYNRENKTLQKYRYNQFAFIHDEKKYFDRNGVWHSTRVKDAKETDPTVLKGVNPIEELGLDKETQTTLRDLHETYDVYSESVL